MVDMTAVVGGFSCQHSSLNTEHYKHEAFSLFNDHTNCTWHYLYDLHLYSFLFTWIMFSVEDGVWIMSVCSMQVGEARA